MYIYLYIYTHRTSSLRPQTLVAQVRIRSLRPQTLLAQQTATATLPSGTGSGNDLKDLFEKNGIADILQRATEELGIKSASDLKFIEKDDLDTLSWLTPVTKRKLLLLMAESHV